MAKKKAQSEELKPAENAAEAPVGSASKPALAPTPEVENEPEKGSEEEKAEGSEEAPVEKKGKKGAKEESAEETFETTAPVSFQVGTKKYEGTVFSFPKEVVEDRKRIVREAYPGVGIK